jgi:hypothetical protein
MSLQKNASTSMEISEPDRGGSGSGFRWVWFVGLMRLMGKKSGIAPDDAVEGHAVMVKDGLNNSR